MSTTNIYLSNEKFKVTCKNVDFECRYIWDSYQKIEEIIQLNSHPKYDGIYFDLLAELLDALQKGSF